MDHPTITRELARCLVAEQFPGWSTLEIRPVALDGWDNTSFRLGEEMSVRIPSHERYAVQVDKEHAWLPVLAPRLPLPIPRPIAKGRPGCGLHTPWSVYGWLAGEPAAVAEVRDYDLFAEDLAEFLLAMQRIPAAAGPPAGAHSFNRGGPVAAWDDQTRAVIGRLGDEIDGAGALAVWEAALASPWAGPDTWVHGDITGSNLLVHDGRLCGVIDFGCAAVGDPACDLAISWTMFEGSSRQRFLSTLSPDTGTIARARGWALWKALIAIPVDAADDLTRAADRFGWRWDALSVVDQVVTHFSSTAVQA